MTGTKPIADRASQPIPVLQIKWCGGTTRWRDDDRGAVLTEAGTRRPTSPGVC